MAAILDDRGVITNAEALTVAETAMKRVWCPACHERVFQKWSGGWDGHAGWKCTGLIGLEAASPEDRKREYRKRFWFLFR